MVVPEKSGAETLRLNKYAVPLLLAMLAFLFAARLHTCQEPLERDITTYAVIGHEMLHGRGLYSDLWDHKPPAVHVTYALADAIFGYGPPAIYAMGVCCAAVTLFGLFYAGSRAPGGKAAGLWAAAFWTLLSIDPRLQANQPNTEVFINAAGVWAFALLLETDTKKTHIGRALAIGLFSALASLYKYIVLTDIILLFAVHIYFAGSAEGARKRAVMQAAAAGAVIFAAWAAVTLYFVGTGHFQEYYETIIVYNRAYSGGIVHNLIHCRPQIPYALLFALVAGILWLQGAAKRDRRAWALMTAFGAGTFLSAALPGRYYAHYFQLWLPPVLFGASWIVTEAGRNAPRKKRIPALAGGLILALLLVRESHFFRASADVLSREKYGGIFVESDRMAAEINRILPPGKTFYEWGSETGLYFVTRRPPPSGIFYNYPLLEGPFREKLTARVIADLECTQPDLLLIRDARGNDLTPPMRQWLMAHYQPFAAEPKFGAYFLYARRGSAFAAPRSGQ